MFYQKKITSGCTRLSLHSTDWSPPKLSSVNDSFEHISHDISTHPNVLYAYLIILISSEHLLSLYQWYDFWRLRINGKKLEAVYFSKKIYGQSSRFDKRYTWELSAIRGCHGCFRSSMYDPCPWSFYQYQTNLQQYKNNLKHQIKITQRPSSSTNLRPSSLGLRSSRYY